MLETFFQNSFNQPLSRYNKIVESINSLEDEMKSLTDDELQNYTQKLKNDLKEGKVKDSIIEQAFSLVREATKRVLNIRHFDVQLIGGLVLNDGKIAEMKTGEGKTIVALLPTFLNALEGKGSHVVTVNDYLAKRMHSFLEINKNILELWKKLKMKKRLGILFGTL